MFKLDKINISGKEVFPIIEGGKGINVSTGLTAGSFAKAGAVGTLSGTNPDFYDENGDFVPYIYDPKATRKEKFFDLMKKSIQGTIAQAKIASDVSGGNGRIHMNFLWEAAGTVEILTKALDKVSDLIHGVTSGAGLPYALSEIAERYNVFYYPIISSDRAFSILWKRSYNKVPNLLGGVVYEDPWLAGGHNGLSNQENPQERQDPYLRIVKLRKALNANNLQHVPIFIAGGLWNLKEWDQYIDNKEVGLVAFQFGTRPLVTKESPIPLEWKKLFFSLREGDVKLHKFSPTGFYSSAINNPFLQELQLREDYQLEASRKPKGEFTKEIPSGNNVSSFYVKEDDYETAMKYINQGFSMLLRTPDKSIIFVEPEKAKQIKEDQQNCMGCLSHCRFSSWKDKEPYTTGLLPDPRSFCIQKTLQNIGHEGGIENNLLFSGHNAYRFASDPLYKDGYIPSIAELVDAISKGE